MSLLECLIILIVALLVLTPEQVIQLSKKLGNIYQQLTQVLQLTENQQEKLKINEEKARKAELAYKEKE